jgi:hypothetical protein
MGRFTLRSDIGKCLTYGQPLDRIDQNTPGGGRPSRTGPAEPIFIYDCIQRSRLHSALLPEVQQIVVEEINERHEVLLRAGTRYLGVVGNIPAARQPLELQDYNGGPGQVFALDGDSIIVAADRGLVVEISGTLGVGRFDDVAGADAVFWGHDNERAVDLVSPLVEGFRRWSTQEMR